MPLWLTFLLYLLGALCFALAAGQKRDTRLSLVPLGLLFWILVPFITTAMKLGD